MHFLALQTLKRKLENEEKQSLEIIPNWND